MSLERPRAYLPSACQRSSSETLNEQPDTWQRMALLWELSLWICLCLAYIAAKSPPPVVSPSLCIYSLCSLSIWGINARHSSSLDLKVTFLSLNSVSRVVTSGTRNVFLKVNRPFFSTLAPMFPPTGFFGGSGNGTCTGDARALSILAFFE